MLKRLVGDDVVDLDPAQIYECRLVMQRARWPRRQRILKMIVVGYDGSTLLEREYPSPSHYWTAHRALLAAIAAARPADEDSDEEDL